MKGIDMAYAWKQAAQGAPKMSEGYHLLKVMRVSNEGKEGEVMRSKSGDPQLRVTVANAKGEQSRILVTLSHAGGWVLAQMLEHSGADLDRMEREGVDVSNFEDIDFATQQLVGRKFWGHCEHKGEYANVRSVAEQDVPPGDLAKASRGPQQQTSHPPASRQAPPSEPHQPVDSDNIPF
jgi:hypothetical protein